MFKNLICITLLATSLVSAQHIENAASLSSFSNKLKENKSVTQVLFLGDSHIQAGWIPEVLRDNFRTKYGNAGRGLVFPYAVANSNGPLDFTSASDKAWQTFRLVYDQDVFKQMGALGFVMGNNENSLIEVKFDKAEDSFDTVKILNDDSMQGEAYQLYKSTMPLSSSITKRKVVNTYTVQDGETFPELAAKFNTTTTRLVQLNGATVSNVKAGQSIKVEQVTPELSTGFDTSLQLLKEGKFTANGTQVSFGQPMQSLILKTNATNGNLFYGFQFLKINATKGVVFNAVGVNGATYADFLKYPLQLQELSEIHPDVAIVSLGTNESLSNITKEDFQKNVSDLVDAFRKDNPQFPILLLSPTDNRVKADKVKDVVSWVKEIASQKNVAFLNMYDATGGRGYFARALGAKTANADGVHFLKPGYESQAQIIWKALSEVLQ